MTEPQQTDIVSEARTTTEPDEREEVAQTPIEDLRKYALEHYERVTTSAHEWYSVIPKAINAYFDSQAADGSPDAATRMRERCVSVVKECAAVYAESNQESARWMSVAASDIITALESLTLDEEKKQ